MATKVIVTTTSGRSYTLTGNVVEILKVYLSIDKERITAKAPLGWIGGNGNFVNFTHAEHICFVEED